MYYIKKFFRKSGFIFLCMTMCVIMFSVLVSEFVNGYNIVDIQNSEYENGAAISMDIGYHEHKNGEDHDENEWEKLTLEEQENIYKKSYENIANYLYELVEKYDITITISDFKRFTNGFYSLGVLSSDDYKQNYNLIEGRFLEAQDYTSNKKVAVIPESAKKHCDEVNGKLYINSGGEKYEVIGIIEDATSDHLDMNYIYYNIQKEDFKIGAYVGDVILESNTLSYKELSDLALSNKYVYSVNDNSRLKLSLWDSLIMYSPLFFKMYGPVLISILIALVLAISYFINDIKYEISIKMLCGAKNKDIILEFMIRMLVISVGALVICPIVQLLIVKLDILKRLVVYTHINFLLNLLFICLVLAMVLWVLVFNIKKIRMLEVIKGR